MLPRSWVQAEIDTGQVKGAEIAQSGKVFPGIPCKVWWKYLPLLLGLERCRVLPTYERVRPR